MKRVVLDTNAYAALHRGDERVLRALTEAEKVYVPVFVRGELLYGFKRGRHELRNRRALDAFMGKPMVKPLHTTDETADVFAGIKKSLQQKGRPVPDNDLWIAALCMEAGGTIVSFDRHFEWIDGLRVWLYEDSPPSA